MIGAIECRYYGRDFTTDEMALLRALIATDPQPTRATLSREFCRRVGWVKPDGGLKDMMARVTMLAMHRDGLIELPPPKGRRNPPRPIVFGPDTEAPLFPAPTTLDEVRPLDLRTVVRETREGRLWNEFVARYHFLGYKTLVGAQMRYAVHDRNGWPVAMLGFSTAAWKLAPRDRFIGWTPELREKNLPLVVDNPRSSPYIPMHVMQSKRIRRERTHRSCLFTDPPTPAATAVRTTPSLIIPPPKTPLRSCPRHILPLRFAQNPICLPSLARQPPHVRLRIVPAHINHRSRPQPPTPVVGTDRAPTLATTHIPLTKRHLVHTHRNRLRNAHPMYRPLIRESPFFTRPTPHHVTARRHHNQLRTPRTITKPFTNPRPSLLLQHRSQHLQALRMLRRPYRAAENRQQHDRRRNRQGALKCRHRSSSLARFALVAAID